MTWIRWIFVFAFLPLFVAPPAKTRSGPVPLETMLDVQIIEESPISFSPDGKWVAYVVRNALPKGSRSLEFTKLYECSGLYPDSISADIVISNVLTGETASIGEGSGDNWMPAWSPDGRYLAFLSDRDGSGQAKLWLWQSETRTLRQVSEVVVRANQIAWTPNSEGILTTIWSNATRPEETDSCKVAGAERNNDSPKTSETSSVVVYQWDREHSVDAKKGGGDPWNLDSKIRDLAEINVQTGEMTRLTHGDRISLFRISPDGSRIAFTTATRFEQAGSQQILFDLRIVARVTGDKKTLAAGVRLDLTGEGFSWSPDGRQLVYQTGGALEKVSDCFLITVSGNDSQNLTALPPRRVPSIEFPPVWDGPRKQVYFVRDNAIWKASTAGGESSELARIPNREIVKIVGQDNEPFRLVGPGDSIIVLTEDPDGKRNGFYKIDLTHGESSLLQEREERYDAANWGAFRQGTREQACVVYLSQSADDPPDLWFADVEFKNPHRLTHVNPELDKYQMGRVQLIHWNGLDGEPLSGALLLPAGYDERKKYPLIVWVYGGVNGSDDRNEFGFSGLGGPYNMQLFATRGYAVLSPDAPQRLGTPMLDLAKTVLPGVNKVVELGVADPNRIGIMGHSYGGYSVLSLIVQTTRFKAAMVSDGLGDLVSAHGQMDLRGSAYQTSITEKGQGLMGGTPWEFRERYIENSPIFYLDRVKTPVLLVHGGADNAVAPFLADQVFVSLRRLGRDVVYARYAGEGHFPYLWSRQNQTDLGNRMLAWFDKFLSN